LAGEIEKGKAPAAIGFVEKDKKKSITSMQQGEISDATNSERGESGHRIRDRSG